MNYQKAPDETWLPFFYQSTMAKLAQAIGSKCVDLPFGGHGNTMTRPSKHLRLLPPATIFTCQQKP
ncbi:hypothetical protein DsansV1_C19g0162081 [Dioscorea sansibarensis]